MESFLSAVRSKVSADKNRYVKGNFDLDLTYITDRIIAMSFPAEGVESAYRNRIDDVAKMLKDTHGDHFMIYNLSERPYDYSKFDNQVHEWCGFPDHHAPPLSKLFQIVKSIHSWLLADKNNIVVVHCLAGKGRTGTVIAAYLIWCGLYNASEEALNFFASKRSNNNWGVTGPSQLRYVQYFSDIVKRNIIPSKRQLHLVYMHLSGAPAFANPINPLSRLGTCTPFIHIYQVSNGKKLIYSSGSENEELRSYTPNQSVTFQIECIISGDILIEMYHVTPFYRTEHMLRFEFHTGMVRSNVLRFIRPEIDIACQDKRFQPDFFIDLGFEQLDPLLQSQGQSQSQSQQEDRWWEGSPQNSDGSICFFSQSNMLQAKSSSKIERKKVEKGGYLTKRGHTVKNWKRRWFVLKDPTLCYYKSPRDQTPAGVIILDDILTILSEKSIYKDIKPAGDRPNNWFEIITKKTNYLICSDTDQDMRDWVEALEFVISQRDSLTSMYKFGSDSSKRTISSNAISSSTSKKEYILREGTQDDSSIRSSSAPTAPIKMLNNLSLSGSNDDYDDMMNSGGNEIDDMIESVNEIESVLHNNSKDDKATNTNTNNDSSSSSMKTSSMQIGGSNIDSTSNNTIFIIDDYQHKNSVRNNPESAMKDFVIVDQQKAIKS